MTTVTWIAGRPDAIDNHVKEMATVADAMTRAADQLRQLHDGRTFKSEALDKIDKNAADVATELDDSAARYTTTAGALSTYSAVLRTAKETVRQANQGVAGLDISHSQESVRQLKQQLHDASLNPATTPTDLAHVQALLNQAKQHLGEQNAANAHYAQLAAEANSDVDKAAQYAIGQIQAAREVSKLNNSPSTWLNNQYAHLKTLYREHIHVYVEILMTALSELSNILAVVSLIIAILPIPGAAALGIVLFGVSRVIGFATTTFEVLEFVFGQISFTDLIVAGIASAVGFLGGKLVAKGFSKLGKMALSGKLGDGIQGLLKKESHEAGGLSRRFNHLIRGTEAHPKTVFGVRVNKASVQRFLKHELHETEHKIEHKVDHALKDLTLKALKGQPPAFHAPHVSIPLQVPRLHLSLHTVENVGELW